MSAHASIIVPCYNEAPNLPALLEAFDAAGLAERGIELVLVDNGSTDETAAVLQELLQHPSRAWARVVTVPRPNVGYGHGILTGLRATSSAWLAWTHADLQTPPRDVLVAFEALWGAANPRRTLVKGRRRGRSLPSRAFTGGMGLAAYALLGGGFSDINAQPKAFHRDLLDLADAPPNDLSLDLYFVWLARRHGFSIRAFDVVFPPRRHGQSSWAFNWRSRARHARRTLDFMLKLRG